MFLMKAIQDRYLSKQDEDDDSVAFVMFNVKGKDLLAIDQPNDFSDEHDPAGVREKTLDMYEKLGLSAEPFQNVHYYFPYSVKNRWNTYMSQEDVGDRIKIRSAQFYKYIQDHDDTT